MYPMYDYDPYYNDIFVYYENDYYYDYMAERRLRLDLERKIAAADRKTQDAERRAQAAERRLAELESALSTLGAYLNRP